MPEVLGIRELGDEPEPRPEVAGPDLVDGDGEDVVSFERRRSPSVWRRWGAILVVVALALAVARSLGGGGAVPTSTEPASTAAPTTVVVAPPAEAAAWAALEDWARFATTGDLDALRDTFDAGGPQFAQLAGEEISPVAGPPYRFDATIGPTSAGSRVGEQVVMADVVVSRPGEADQRFSWEVVMRQGADQSWRLWTVRARAASNASVGGAP